MSTNGYALILTGTLGQNEVFFALTYKNGEFSLEQLTFSSFPSYAFHWMNGNVMSFHLIFLDEELHPLISFPLTPGQNYFLGAMVNGQILVLTYSAGNFHLNNNTDIETRVRVIVPPTQTLKTNDVRTRNYLRVGEDHLVDLISTPQLSCKKLYLSPIFQNLPDPNASEFLVGQLLQFS